METEVIETTKARYLALEVHREPFLKRARESAKLTVPTLIPEAGHSTGSDFYQPFQGIGARGVNNISSKLLLTLFPTTGSCFRMVIDKEALAKAGVKDDQITKFEEALSKYESAVSREFEVQALRPSVHEAIKHLVVAGNVCLYSPPEGGLKVYRLDRYVCSRDPMGNLTEIITKESVDPRTLPKDLRELIKPHVADQPGKPVDLFTRVYLDEDGKFKVCQEICEIKVPGSEGIYLPEKLPFIVLRWTRIDGESYGRGYVEDFLGFLKSDEGLSQAIVEGAAASSKILILCNPNGPVTPKMITSAPNGAAIPGSETDVTMLQAQKAGDLQVASSTIQQIEQHLSYIFLLNSAIQRNGERVTAEEIRYMAGEIEDALGGVYSLLSVEFQLKLVQRLIAQCEAKGTIRKLPKKLVRPTIVTGLEALGRGHEANRLKGWFGDLAGMVGPEQAAAVIQLDELARRLGNAYSVDLKGLVKTPEDLAAEQQQAQMAQLTESLGPEVIKAGAQLATTAGPSAQPQPSE